MRDQVLLLLHRKKIESLEFVFFKFLIFKTLLNGSKTSVQIICCSSFLFPTSIKATLFGWLFYLPYIFVSFPNEEWPYLPIKSKTGM